MLPGANLHGYENPQFTKEINKMANNNSFGDQISMAQVREDINNLASRVKTAKNNKDKIKILMKGKKAMEKDAGNISSQIQKDVANLLNAKGIALAMNSTLMKYQAKLKKAQMSKLKLSDVITIKKKLIKKLTKEVQGFRTAPSDYSDLTKVDANDIKKIIRKIKKDLGY